MARTQALIAARRADPRDDVVYVLAGLELADDDVITLALELVIARNDTAANLIAHMVGFLLEDRSRWERVRADRSLIDAAVEETLRRRGPSKGLRRATRDVEPGGETIARGEILHVLFAAAGHDPVHVERPRDSSTWTAPSAGRARRAAGPLPGPARGAGPDARLRADAHHPDAAAVPRGADRRKR
jgi:cytochrome P450